MADECAAGTEPFVFEGIDNPNGTIFPDVLLDRVMAHLSGAEFKVLAYIVRRTFGFKKNADAISLDQICHGIARRDGSILDEGTGLTRKTAIAALKSLEEKGVITVVRRSSPSKGNLPSTFALRFRTSPPHDGQDAIAGSDEDASRLSEEVLDAPSAAAPRRGKHVLAQSATPGVKKGAPRGDISIPPREENPHPGSVRTSQGRVSIFPSQATVAQATVETTRAVVVKRSDMHAASSQNGPSMEVLTGEQAEALALLINQGVSAMRALDLCQRFHILAIRQQVLWLDSRRYDDRAACLVAAIEHNYGPPISSAPRGTARRPAQFGARHRASSALPNDPGRYSRGPYGVCAACGCSPCDPACPSPRKRGGMSRENSNAGDES